MSARISTGACLCCLLVWVHVRAWADLPRTFAEPETRGERVVVVAGEAIGGQDEGPAAVRARALRHARERALHELGSVRVGSRLVHHLREGAGASQTIARTVTQARDALFVREEIVRERVEPLGGALGLKVRVELRVWGVARTPPACSLGVRLSRQNLVRGDQVSVEVTTDRAVALVFLWVDAEGRATLLGPRVESGELRAVPGQTVRFPTSDMERRGLRLRAEIQRATDASHEALHVVGVPVGAAFAVLPTDTLTLGALYARLLASGITDFCEAAHHYVIRDR